MYFKKNVIRKTFSIAFLFLYGVSFSQNFHVKSGASISVAAGHALHIKGSLTIESNGSLILNSDATKSASLMLDKGATVSGDITYKRYVDSDWHIVSAPVSSQSVPTFVADANNAVAQSTSSEKYAVAYYKNNNNSGKRWVYHVQNNSTAENEEVLTNFDTAKGYAMKRSSPGTYAFTGGTTASDVSTTLTTSGGTTHRWHGVGNPFPSFIAANNNANSSNNILQKNLNILDDEYAVLYVWDDNEYKTIDQTSSISDATFAPGQGFMIKTKGDSHTFVFEKDATSHQGGNMTFHRNSNTSIPTIMVHLSNDDKNKSTTVKYLNNTTLGLDPGYDAGAYQDGTPIFAINTHLVSDSNGTDFTQQCLPESALGTVVIPLSVYAQENLELNFSATTSDFPTSFENEIYIEDRENNTLHNISGDTAYQITLSNAVSGIGRFYLHTSSTTLGTDDSQVLDLVNIYTSSRDNLRIEGVQHETATVQLYNILGNQVLNTEFNGNGMNDIKLPDLSIGVYIVRLITLKGITKKKIIIQ